MDALGISPIAWLHSRSYSRILRTLAMGGQEALTLATTYAAALAPVMKAVELTDRRVLAKHIVTLEIASERGSDKVDLVETRAELRLVQSLHSFIGRERQVFEFDDALIAELARTDVADVFPSDIHVPYHAFYLRLPGALPDVDGRAVEGILVQHLNYQDMGPSLVLDFLPPFTSADDMAAALPSMPIAVVPLRGESSLGTEIDVANWRIATPGFMADKAREMGVGRPGEEWFDRSLDATRRRYEAGNRYAQDNLALIVNALLFIDNCRGEQIGGWSADAPRALVAKATGGAAGARKAEQKLVQAGWTKVTLCQVDRAPSHAEPDQPTGRVVRAHWRRGHWRRQPHGPGLSLTRLVRVRPTMVGTGRMAEGRTYTGRLAADSETAAS